MFACVGLDRKFKVLTWKIRLDIQCSSDPSAKKVRPDGRLSFAL
jgi:hypothetical protein